MDATQGDGRRPESSIVYRDERASDRRRGASNLRRASLHAPAGRAADDCAGRRGGLPAGRIHLVHEHLHGLEDRLVVRRLAHRRDSRVRAVHGHGAVPVGAGVQHHADVGLCRGHDGVGSGAASGDSCDGPAGIRDPHDRPVPVGPVHRLSGSVLRSSPAPPDDRCRQTALPHRNRDGGDDPGDVCQGPRGCRQGSRAALGRRRSGCLHACDLLCSGLGNAACGPLRDRCPSSRGSLGISILPRPHAVRGRHPDRTSGRRQPGPGRDRGLGDSGALGPSQRLGRRAA